MQDEGQRIFLRVRQVVPELLREREMGDILHFLDGLIRQSIRVTRDPRNKTSPNRTNQ